jgi:hypothetical protein
MERHSTCCLNTPVNGVTPALEIAGDELGIPTNCLDKNWAIWVSRGLSLQGNVRGPASCSKSENPGTESPKMGCVRVIWFPTRIDETSIRVG